MKIGILAPIAWRTPPEHYGGWELVAHHLTEGLVARGHDVTLFATSDSLTKARLESVCPHPLNQPGHALDSRVYETLHIAHAFERAKKLKLDVLHNHAGCFGTPFAHLISVPTVTTLHGSAAEAGSRTLYEHYRDLNYVSISDSERKLAPDLSYVATVYNGVKVASFEFQESPGDYLIVIGRMSPDKGIHLAIQVAQQAGLPLVLAGIVPSENESYFRTQIEPHLNDQIRFIGPVNHREKSRWLAGAKASLHLVTYEEAFGLTMAESMACGTPVVAIRRGSVPELIEHRRTGFIVNPASDDEMVADAVAFLSHVADLDRRYIREHTEKRFGVERMVKGYEAVYKQLLAPRQTFPLRAEPT
ncbi:Glycosyltransferase involved in cell wall bisynthesis [Catalinimonas alkaloidigena]|uniref:Glycosyltransferase involved in cell wall bisynthesis n=1 Tax=Catalinimonas alkaloidigena TaxID=1075417 RepID=A0A1G8XQ30_9BACT|nr:glycosyltransferase family 4 protein [Catalinimonas alkaloidigena]SDJ92577.1 Glycosyltransferase involved in cell wall bisynthesis [Catalinimonas alkaloidigena]